GPVPQFCIINQSVFKKTNAGSVVTPGPLFCPLLQELFVQHLAACSYRHGSGKDRKALTYSDLAGTAERTETFQFLADILPRKILASKYLKMLKEKREEDEGEDAAAAASDGEAEP
ncbi:PREDICTED: chromatin accessibility complex protein 1, partial [Condylura cristata]|uniref:chromatin accessibility complex protein 1 n=1 Tax=Condylura cristata TaxID=143302 RepID=UPI000643012D